MKRRIEYFLKLFLALNLLRTVYSSIVTVITENCKRVKIDSGNNDDSCTGFNSCSPLRIFFVENAELDRLESMYTADINVHLV